MALAYSRTNILYFILFIFILLLGLYFFCCRNNKIELEFYRNEVVSICDNSQICPTLDTLIQRINILAENLNVDHQFKYKILEDTVERTVRNDCRVMIRLDPNHNNNPGYSINRKLITIPSDIFKDPVIFMHELFHYFYDYNMDIHLSTNENVFNGCNIKKQPCLNLMNSHTSHSKPLAYLVTDSQIESANKMYYRYQIDKCDLNSVSFQTFPDFLISQNVEDLISCCNTISLTTQELRQIYLQYFNVDIDINNPSVQNVLTIVNEMKARGICINEASENSISELTNTLQSVFTATGISPDTAIVNMVSLIGHYRMQNQFKNKETIMKDKQFFKYIFGEKYNKDFYPIRKNTYKYFESKKLRKQGFTEKIIAQMIE